jgi:competence transcription factor ComK
MDIDYIRTDTDGRTLIVGHHGSYVTDHTVAYVLDALLAMSLTTLKGRLAATRRMTGWSRKVPVYVNPDHVFMVLRGLRSPKTLIVNVKHVVSLERRESKGGVIVFAGGHALGFDSWSLLERQWERVAAWLERLDRRENVFIGKTD